MKKIRSITNVSVETKGTNTSKLTYISALEHSSSQPPHLPHVEVACVAVEETDHVYYHYSCPQEWEVEGLEPPQTTPHPPQKRPHGGQGCGML